MHTHFSIETVTNDFATFSNVLYKNDYEDLGSYDAVEHEDNIIGVLSGQILTIHDVFYDEFEKPVFFDKFDMYTGELEEVFHIINNNFSSLQKHIKKEGYNLDDFFNNIYLFSSMNMKEEYRGQGLGLCLLKETSKYLSRDEDSFIFLNTTSPKLIEYYQSEPDLAFNKVSNESSFLFAQNSQQRLFDFNMKYELLDIEERLSQRKMIP